MNRFLKRILKTHRFEEMTIPLGVVATDLGTGQPIRLADWRAVRRHPRGLLLSRIVPSRTARRKALVDGAMSMEIPAELCRQLGATHVTSGYLPAAP